MDVSKNNGTPQISHFNRVFIINHPFWGKHPYFRKPPIWWRWRVGSSRESMAFLLKRFQLQPSPVGRQPSSQQVREANERRSAKAMMRLRRRWNFMGPETLTWWFKVTFLGWLSDPCKGLSDLQLGDEKVTLNHLAEVFLFFFGKGRWTWPRFFFFSSKLTMFFWYVFSVCVVHSFPMLVSFFPNPLGSSALEANAHVGCDLPRPTEVPSTVFPGCGSCLFGEDCAFSHLFHGYVYLQYL